MGENSVAKLSATTLKFASILDPCMHHSLKIRQITDFKGRKKKFKNIGFAIKEKLSRIVKKVGTDW